MEEIFRINQYCIMRKSQKHSDFYLAYAQAPFCKKHDLKMYINNDVYLSLRHLTGRAFMKDEFAVLFQTEYQNEDILKLFNALLDIKVILKVSADCNEN